MILNFQKILKVLIAILLLICLLNMPYGYYHFVRYAAAAIFVYLAIEEKNNKNKSFFFVFIVLAVLFQPIVKIALGRMIWNIVDIAVAGFLLYSLAEPGKHAKNN